MLGNLKIVARLALGFGILVILIAGLSGYAVLSGTATSAEVDRAIRLADNGILTQQIEKKMFQGRMLVWVALATGDQGKLGKAAAAFQAARDTLTTLRAATFAPERVAKIEALRELLDAYSAEAAKITLAPGQAPSLDVPATIALAGQAAAIAGRIDVAGEDLSQNFQAIATEVETQAKTSIRHMIDVSIVVGMLSIALGAALSLVVSRSVSRPITAMTIAMRALANGDTSVTIPAVGRTDEIGEMAEAVEVFIRLKELQEGIPFNECCLAPFSLHHHQRVR